MKPWGLLTLYNLVRLQRLKVAHEHGVPARGLSFRCAALPIGSVWSSAWLTPPGTIYGLMSEMGGFDSLAIRPLIPIPHD